LLSAFAFFKVVDCQELSSVAGNGVDLMRIIAIQQHSRPSRDQLYSADLDIAPRFSQLSIFEGLKLPIGHEPFILELLAREPL
jgi:hypothetical protein